MSTVFPNLLYLHDKFTKIFMNVFEKVWENCKTCLLQIRYIAALTLAELALFLFKCP